MTVRGYRGIKKTNNNSYQWQCSVEEVVRTEIGGKRRRMRKATKLPQVTSIYELRAAPSLTSKRCGAETSFRQTGRFTSAVPQLPVTLTVVGFKSGPALELPGYTWRRVIKRRSAGRE